MSTSILKMETGRSTFILIDTRRYAMRWVSARGLWESSVTSGSS